MCAAASDYRMSAAVRAESHRPEVFGRARNVREIVAKVPSVKRNGIDPGASLSPILIGCRMRAVGSCLHGNGGGRIIFRFGEALRRQIPS